MMQGLKLVPYFVLCFSFVIPAYLQFLLQMILLHSSDRSISLLFMREVNIEIIASG